MKNIKTNTGMVDLSQPRLGTKIIYKTDDFFAPAERIINPNPPIWKENYYDENGKWMDGWESRRKRTDGNDFIILLLGKPGRISEINVDTTYFNGNQPNYISIEGSYEEKLNNQNDYKWTSIINKSKVKPNSHNFFKIKNKNKIYNIIKFNIYPDGGVARLRLYGNVATEKLFYQKKEIIELSSILNGSSIIATNNEHFGKAENILAPGKALDMSDGWETRRRRTKGFDWVIFKFGIPGKINKILIDTNHFKGNYPDYFSLQATNIKNDKKITKSSIIKKSVKWSYLLKNQKLEANKEHYFDNKLLIEKKINYLKLNIFPDGGISRINIFGEIN